METLPIWFTLPQYLPFDNQLCYVRVKYYYSNPFLATWDHANKQFISVENSIIYPAWTIARWRECSNSGDLILSLISDQDPLNTINFTIAGLKYFAYSINWGDGNSVSGYYTGAVESFSHSYAAVGNKTITITMPSASMTYFDMTTEPIISEFPDITYFAQLYHFRIANSTSLYNTGDLSFSFPKLELFNIIQNNLSGVCPSFIDSPLLNDLKLEGNNFTGPVPDFSNNLLLDTVRISNLLLATTLPAFPALSVLTKFWCFNSQLSGTVPDLSLLLILQDFRAYTNTFDDYTASTIALTTTNFLLYDNALPAASINQVLADFVTNLASRPIAGTLNLSGGTNAAPTGQGIIDKAAIIAHGWAVTTN